MTTNEVESRAREMKAAGASIAAIADKLGISKSKAYKLTKGIKVEEGPVESKGFLDAEGKFAQLLTDYGIKDVSRITAYASSQGDVYRDLSLLRQCLLDQGVTMGKVAPIIKHWAAIEQLPLPQKLATELASEASVRQPEKWTVLDGRPTRDPDGEYESFLQALKVAHMETGKSSPDADQLRVLTEKIEALEDERNKAQVAAVLNAVSELRGEIATLKVKDTAQNEFSIMQQGLGILDRRTGSIESAIISRFGLPAAPLGEREKKKLTEAISEQSQADAALDALADRVFYGKDKAPAEAVEVAPLTGSFLTDRFS
ncbi:hypothetical protein ES703_59793 [subsurface metagenome]